MNPKALRVATIVVGILCAAFFIAQMRFRFWAASSQYALQADQAEAIGVYWRYHVDGAIPPGLLMSEQAFAHHAPPFWLALMAATSTFMNPLWASRVLGLLAWILLAGILARVVARRTPWAFAFCVVALLLRAPPDQAEQLVGGMPESIGPFLVLLFLDALMTRRHKLALAALVLQAGACPVVVLPCGITYAAYVLVRGPMRDRFRRIAGALLAGVVVVALWNWEAMRSPASWGEPMKLADAQRRPAFKSNGRFTELPLHDFTSDIRDEAVRPFQRIAPAKAPATPEAPWSPRALFLVFVLVPLGVVGAAGVARFLRRGKAPAAAPMEGRRASPFPREVTALAGGALAAFWLVRAEAFALGLPSAQLASTLHYLVIVGLPLLVWWAVEQLAGDKHRWAPLVVTVAVAVAPVFALQGFSLERGRYGYARYQGDAAFYEAVRKLPLGHEIACDLRFCDKLMAFGAHVPYAARNLAYPLRDGYYREADRRIVATYKLLYATTPREIADFVRNEKIRYLVYDRTQLDNISPAFSPLREELKRLRDEKRRNPRILADPPEAAVVFRDGDRFIVDLRKL